MNIYLAGGMRSGWQKLVKDAVPHNYYFDPSLHLLTEESEYTLWDIAAINSSEILFAFLEKDNPSGYGLMLELGYAAAKGKFIIFVNEKEDTPEDKYCGMARVMASFYTKSLTIGIQALEDFIAGGFMAVRGYDERTKT